MSHSNTFETRRRWSRLQQVALVVVLAAATILVAQARAKSRRAVPVPPLPVVHPEPTREFAPIGDAQIEVAFVLDTTGSMSGLIEGAKQKIWSIANQMASSKQKASVRMALIGYRDRGDEYVTKRFDLTTDIDAIYGHLRAFQANGGGDTPESVNQALKEAVQDLSWSEGDNVYRVIFLVGDAPPHTDYPQDVQYAVTARNAKNRGIMINTIQCGGQPNTTPVWQEIAGLGLGQYASIAQDGGMVALASPMDDELAELNRKMASTVVEYGEEDRRNEMKAKVANSVAADAPAAASRLSYLSKRGGRAISGMSDLVDAVKDGLSLGAVSEDSLPEAMVPMSVEEREAYVAERLEQRKQLQARIDDLSTDRDGWIKKETARQRADGEAEGFDAKVLETITSQAAEKGIVYE